MIASSQVKHPRAISLGAQSLTCTYPPTFWYPYTCLCDILPTGFVLGNQVIAAGLDLLCMLGLPVQCVHRCHGAGHGNVLPSGGGAMDPPGKVLSRAQPCLLQSLYPQEGLLSNSWQISQRGLGNSCLLEQTEHYSSGGLQIFILSLNCTVAHSESEKR